MRGFCAKEKLACHAYRSGTWVAVLIDMQPSHTGEDIPGLDGPDYLAVVIEWNDDDPTLVKPRPPNLAPAARHRLATVLGVLGAVVFATWGIRHLRAAW